MSNAREVYRDGDRILSDTELVVATMANVAAGSYVVSAKTVVVQTENGGSDSEIRCTLDAGSTSTDYAQTEMGNSNPRRQTLATHVLATFSAQGTIVLRCMRIGSDRETVARQTKIIAVQVGSITRAAVTG